MHFKTFICIILLIQISIINAQNQINNQEFITHTTTIVSDLAQNKAIPNSLLNNFTQNINNDKNDILKLTGHVLNASYSLEEVGQYAGALNLLNTTIHFLRYDSINSNLFSVYNSLGNLNMRLGDNKRASIAYLKALNIAENIKCDSCMASIYNNLGEFYLNKGDLEKTKISLENALELNLKLNHKQEVRINYINLGIIYNLKKNYLKAKDCYDKSFNLLDTTNTTDYAVINLNISQIYTSQGQHKIAEKYLRKGLELVSKNPHNIVTHKIGLVLAKCLAYQNKTKESLMFAKQALKTANKLNISGKKAETYRTLTDVYLILGDSSRALKYMLDYELINDSINQKENTNAINRLLSVHEVELLRKEKLELEQANKINQLTVSKQKTFNVSAAFIMALLVLILIVIYRKFKSDKEKNQLLNEQKELMLAFEKDQFEQQRQQMEQEIDFKNRQLTTQTLTQAANNEFKIKISKELSEIKKQINDAKPKTIGSKIDKLILNIKRASNNYLSEEFKTYFDSVHPSFYDNLIKKHPDLTTNEIKLCSFLKMGLSTKEIANLTFREIRSVESARNRLRKKLIIESESNIHTYLVGF